jgi:hypothetical protein
MTVRCVDSFISICHCGSPEPQWRQSDVVGHLMDSRFRGNDNSICSGNDDSIRRGMRLACPEQKSPLWLSRAATGTIWRCQLSCRFPLSRE